MRAYFTRRSNSTMTDTQHHRLIVLGSGPAGYTAAFKPIATLAAFRLEKIHGKIKKALKTPSKLDAYSLAHLSEARKRIEKALDADYVYNASDMSGGGGGFLFLMKDTENENP